MKIPSGATDRVVFFVAIDPIDLKTRETGLSSFTVYYSLDDAGSETVMTAPTTVEIDAVNMPGVYSLLIDEVGMTTLDVAHDTEELVLHITHASMAPVTRVIEIYRLDVTEGRTLGVSAGGDVKLASDGLNEVTTAEPTGAPNTWTFEERLNAVFRALFYKSDNDGSKIQYYKDDDVTPLAEQTVSDFAGVETIDKATAP